MKAVMKRARWVWVVVALALMALSQGAGVAQAQGALSPGLPSLVVVEVDAPQPGLLEAHAEGADTSPMLIEVGIKMDPGPLRRPQLRLGAEIYDADDVLVATVWRAGGSWVSMPSQPTEFGLELQWSLSELDPGSHPDKATYRVEASVELATSGPGGTVVARATGVGFGEVEMAALIEEVPLDAPFSVEIDEPANPAYGLGVDIPQGAVTSDGPLTLTVRALDEAPAGQGFTALMGPVLEVELPGATFNDEILLTLPWSGGSASPLVLYYDPEIMDWRPEPPIAFDSETVTVSVDHLSVWTVTERVDDLNVTYQWSVDLTLISDIGEGREAMRSEICGLENTPPCPGWWSTETGGSRSFWRVRREGALGALQLQARFTDDANSTLILAADKAEFGGAPTETVPTFPALCAVGMQGFSAVDGNPAPAPFGLKGLPNQIDCEQSTKKLSFVTAMVEGEEDIYYPIDLGTPKMVGWAEVAIATVSDGTEFSGSNAIQCSDATTAYLRSVEDAQGLPEGFEGSPFECMLMRFDPAPSEGVWSGDVADAITVELPEGMGITGSDDFVDPDDETTALAPWKASLLTFLGETTVEEAMGQCEAKALAGEGALLPAQAVSEASVSFEAPSEGAPSEFSVALVAIVGNTSASSQAEDGLDTQGIVACHLLKIDRDGDGYFVTQPEGSTEALDCDDTNPDINPGAEERCDSTDYDCDGDPNNGVTTTGYMDADGDGYGDSDRGKDVCSESENVSLISGDCDDTNPDINPGATETCDGLDNNCDGQVDEGLMAGYFEDLDGDGYGGIPAGLCAETSGVVTVGGDCDDTNPDINPAGDALWLGPEGQLTGASCSGALPPGVLGSADLDGDGQAEGLLVAPTGVEGALQEIIALVFSGVELLPSGAAPIEGLLLEAGVYIENLNIQGEGRVLSLIAAAEGVVLDAGREGCQGLEPAERCSALWVHDGARVTLEGLTLSNGRGTAGGAFGLKGDYATARHGGAVLVQDAGLEMAKVTLERNEAHFGGALLVGRSGSPEAPVQLVGCTLRENTTLNTSVYGTSLFSGALLSYGGSSLTMTHSHISGNERLWHVQSEEAGAQEGVSEAQEGALESQGAGLGAGVVLFDTEASLISNVFEANQGYAFSALAVWTEVGGPPIELLNNRFETNVATAVGSALTVFSTVSEGGSSGVAPLSVVANVFANNTASLGSVWLSGQPIAAFDNNLIANNRGVVATGGVYLAAPGQALFNNLFDRNLGPTMDGVIMAPADLRVSLPTEAEEALRSLGLTQGLVSALYPPLQRQASTQGAQGGASAKTDERVYVDSNVFNPAMSFYNSVSCEGSSFSFNLLWQEGSLESDICEPQPEGNWAVWGEPQAPFAVFLASNDWYENDYHLIEAAQDVGNPALLDPDGSRNDPGLYGGPDGGRGPGAFTSGCVSDPTALSGVLGEARGGSGGSLTGALGPRDLSLPQAKATPFTIYQDLYLLWARAGEAIELEAQASAFEPVIAVYGPETLRYGPPEAWGPTLACTDGGSTDDEGELLFDGHTLWPAEDGYHLVQLSANPAGPWGTGPYTLSWR